MNKQELEAKHGKVWDSEEFLKDFTPLDQLQHVGQYAIVRRAGDAAKGTLEFQNEPRFYYNFELEK